MMIGAAATPSAVAARSARASSDAVRSTSSFVSESPRRGPAFERPGKAARQAEKRRKHNASLRSALTSAIKSVTKAIAAGDKAAARKTFSEASGIMDRIADKNVIHKNEAARHKSRLAVRLKAMAG